MSAQHVQVTYAAPLHFLPSDQWTQVLSALSSQLPLRNIHWKPASRLSIRTIQELEVNLVALDSLRDEGTSQVPLTLLVKPFLNIYVVTCEDNEMYKNTVKKQIKDWHTTVSQRRNQEWLILFVVRPDARVNAGGGLLKMRGTVLDRIKADFNTDKKDRCVQLTWSTGFDSPAAWIEITEKIKEGIASAFDSAVAQKEDEIKRSESQRQMPGWNFCTFFILKESLAISFEGMNLFEDAQIQYDELEASFFQVLKEKNLSWFGRLIDPGPNDDSLPLLSVKKKPYRDLILANTISVFDFRVYLLARQCSLLGQMGRVEDAGRRSGAFLGAFSKTLREVEDSLPTFFIESWVYSSALSVVDQCDEWSHLFELDAVSVASFNAVKGELLELARIQLDKLGIRLNHLPDKPPFASLGNFTPLFHSPATTSSLTKRISKTITNLDIIALIADQAVFYELYVRLTNRAIDLYTKTGRRKFALKLHGNLAALDFYRERHESALQTYTSLPAHYSPHRWSSLETFMLFCGIETYASMGNDKDRDWIHTALAFLKSFTGDLHSDLLLGVEDKDDYVTSLMVSIRNAATTIETDLYVQDHPMISVRVDEGHGVLADTRDGFHLDVVLTNRLPCDVLVDEITLLLAGRDSERLKFATGATILVSGRSSVTLFCPISLPGLFVLKSSEVRLAHIVFEWTCADFMRRRRSVTAQKENPPKLVRLPKDVHALNVIVGQPRRVQVGSSSQLSVSVVTGRNKIVKALVRIASPDVKLTHSEGMIDCDSKAANIDFAEEGVTIANADANQIVSFLIPHSDAVGLNAIRVTIDLEYITTDEPSLTRKMAMARTVTTSLAVAVVVQDFFRSDRLFSKFTVSATSDQHVRISSVGLEVAEEDASTLKVSAVNGKRRITTVTPAYPASFIFQMQSNGEEATKSLKLRIKYRLFQEEIEDLLSRHVKALPVDSGVLLQHYDAIRNSLIKSLGTDSEWVEIYLATGELHCPKVSDLEGSLHELLEQVRQNLSNADGPSYEKGEWREVTIPLDVPFTNILATTRIYLTADPFSMTIPVPDKLPSVFAGQPISAVLSIHTSFYWSRLAERPKGGYRMQFEVAEMINDWLISGRKRGEFLATHDSIHRVPVTLVAMHHGEISLPKVMLAALPAEGSTGAWAAPSIETYQVHGAERVLVLPRSGRTTFMLSMPSEE